MWSADQILNVHWTRLANNSSAKILASYAIRAVKTPFAELNRTDQSASVRMDGAAILKTSASDVSFTFHTKH